MSPNNNKANGFFDRVLRMNNATNAFQEAVPVKNILVTLRRQKKEPKGDGLWTCCGCSQEHLLTVSSGDHPFGQLLCDCGHQICAKCTTTNVLRQFKNEEQDLVVVDVVPDNIEVPYGQVCPQCGTTYRARRQQLDKHQGIGFCKEPCSTGLEFLGGRCVCGTRPSVKWFRFRIGSNADWKGGHIKALKVQNQAAPRADSPMSYLAVQPPKNTTNSPDGVIDGTGGLSRGSSTTTISTIRTITYAAGIVRRYRVDHPILIPEAPRLERSDSFVNAPTAPESRPQAYRSRTRPQVRYPHARPSRFREHLDEDELVSAREVELSGANDTPCRCSKHPLPRRGKG